MICIMSSSATSAELHRYPSFEMRCESWIRIQELMIHNKFPFFAVVRLFRDGELLARSPFSAIQSPLEMRAKRRREEIQGALQLT